MKSTAQLVFGCGTTTSSWRNLTGNRFWVHRGQFSRH